MTFKGELRKLKKGAVGLNKKRWRHAERLAIEEFIKGELREEAKKGTNSKDFPTSLEREINLEGKNIAIKEWDYIWFAIRHRLWFQVTRNESFLSLNYVRIFF